MENKAKYSVLLVDDEPEILDKFTNYIQEQDLNVYKFTNPNQAISCLIENQYEIVCIISDFALPDMTGLEFRQKIIQNYSHIPFIICSLPISPDDKLHALELKISSFIQKPVSKEELIKNILEQSKNRITQLNDDRELKLGFVAEAENLLEELEGLLLDLENNQDQESLNRIFAIIHTIKGSSGFFQEDIINKFTHKYEDFFSPYNKKLKPLSQNIIDILLKGADVIKNLVQALKNNTIYHHNLDNYLPLLNDLKLAQTQEQSKLSTENTQQNNNLAKAKEDIKVGLNLLDEFSELSGEITVIRNMINKAVKNIEKEFTGNKNVSTLCELLSEMHKINSTLQEKVVDIRKAPLKNIFKPLQRTVRDLAITLKKSVNFKITNDDLRVDTTISEVLSNSLIHMIRNSVDHGIELPADRLKSGKQEQGTISISAKELSEEILVQIADDGKGLNTEFLRKKIVEKNLRNSEIASKMSDKEVWDMIFESGFSTAQVVTDVSGRGVGMDMVKKSILKIGGRIEIDSKLGIGTTFSIYLPVPKSVTIIGSVLVECKKEIFAIPQDNIVRLINFNQVENQIQLTHLHGADCLLIDNELLPIIDLNIAFSEKPNSLNESKLFQKDKGQFVIAKAENIKYAIHVDQIIDQEDTVVKKFGSHLKHLNQFLGATFSGDGSVSLIIDTWGLASMYNLKERTEILKSEQEKNTQAVLQGYHEEKKLLLFKLDSPGVYAVLLDEVYRLEKFSKNTLQKSGEQNVILYRDKIVPIYKLETLIFNHEIDKKYNHQIKISEEMNVIIVKNNDSFIGYHVNEIEDLVQTSLAIDESFSHGNYLVGASIIGNITVTIVSLKLKLKDTNSKMPKSKNDVAA